MCSICGFLSRNAISEAELSRMNDSMAYRGPDDSGVEINPVSISAGNGRKQMVLGFAHRRLSIMDLSPKGHQPMHSPDGRVSLVFNGEIYNFRDLRKELDYSFQSDCDTEVLIASYLKWGIDCVNHFNGMFAFALFDREEGKLFLCRDRLGVKPLYYWLSDDGIVFSSELKGILMYPGFQGEIDYSVLPDYFVRKYIRAPKTIFKDVYKLESGTWASYDGGSLQKHVFWNPTEKYLSHQSQGITDFDEAKAQLRETLTEAVGARMIADVSVGLFLSGGYDSSLVAAMAQSVSDAPVNTFSIGFEDRKISEDGYAQAVADELGTYHTNRIVSEDDLLRLVPELSHYYDEPFADGSQLPMLLVSELAKESGITVVLTGDGGDEFFCGYGSYRISARGNLRAAASDFLRFSKVSSLLKAGLLVKQDRLRYHSERRVSNRQVCRMLSDMEGYLPDDICCKVDRATMRSSLEARCPILDVNVAELSYRIPQEFKYRDGCLKYILKELAYDYIPKQLLDRPKQGFGIPYNSWLHGPLREMALDYTSEARLKRQGIFQADAVSKFVSAYMQDPVARPDYSDLVWAMLMFQMWYAEWMEGKRYMTNIKSMAEASKWGGTADRRRVAVFYTFRLPDRKRATA